jgi:hypothetical protein
MTCHGHTLLFSFPSSFSSLKLLRRRRIELKTYGLRAPYWALLMEACSPSSPLSALNGSECVSLSANSIGVLRVTDFFPAHFSENWGYLSMSPIVAGNLFSLVFGRNLDAHDGSSVKSSVIRSAVAAAPQCLEGLECYVNTIYLTSGATFLSVLLSIWAGYRDREKIAASRLRKRYLRRSTIQDWEREES